MSPQQVLEFDPSEHQQDPTRALTLVIRGLRAGERVALPNGTVVRSVTVPHGTSQERRFAVAGGIISRRAAEAKPFRTASEAALTALKL